MFHTNFRLVYFVWVSPPSRLLPLSSLPALPWGRGKLVGLLPSLDFGSAFSPWGDFDNFIPPYLILFLIAVFCAPTE